MLRSEINVGAGSLPPGASPMSDMSGAVVRLTADDAGLLAEHLLRLDRADRRLRFCGSVAENTIKRHCDSLDWNRAVVLGTFIDGVLRAVAELVPYSDAGSRGYELAVTVERPFQGQGLATRLLSMALAMASNRCAQTITLICLPENRQMQHIARKFGARLAFRGGEVEGRIRQPWPTTSSLADEAAMQGRAILRTLRRPPSPTLAE